MRNTILRFKLTVLFIIFACLPMSSQDYFGMIKMPANGGENLVSITPNDDVFVSIWGMGLFRSTDNGSSFSLVYNGGGGYINDIVTNNSGHLFVATAGNGLFRSTNGGVNFTDITGDIKEPNITALYVTRDQYIFAGTSGGGIYLSTDNGDSWTESNTGLMYRDITSMIEVQNGFFIASTYGGGMYMTRDTGKTWKVENSSLTNDFVNDFAENQQGEIFAATNGSGVVYSVNNGVSWAEFDSLMQQDFSAEKRLPDFNATCVVINQNNEPVFGTRNFGIFYYEGDTYHHWQRPIQRNQGITDMAINSQGKIFATQADGAMFVSDDDGRTWAESAELMQQKDFNVYPHKNGEIYGALNSTIYFSSDRGESWQQRGSVSDGVMDMSIDSLNRIIVGASDGLYRSTDGGDSFSRIGFSDTSVVSVEVDKNNALYAGWNYIEVDSQGEVIVDTSGISFSPDMNLWTKCNIVLQAPPNVMRVNSKGYIYFIDFRGSIAYSLNNGIEWKNSDPTDNSIIDFHFVPNVLVAVTNDKVLLSSGHGQNWIERNVANNIPGLSYKNVCGTGNGEIYVIAKYTESIFPHEGIYLSENNGEDWDSVYTSVSMTQVKDFETNLAGDVYVYTGLLWRAYSKKTLEIPSLNLPAEGEIVQDFNPVFSWEPAFKADLYQLEISNSSNFGYIWEKITFGDTAHKVFRPLDPNTTYYWRVRSKNNQAVSNWHIRSFKTTLGSPVLVSPSDDSSGVATTTNLVWEEVDGAEEYHLQVASDELFTDLVFDDSSVTVTNPQRTLPGSTELFWRVKAKNAETEGHWSDTWSFITVLGPPALISPADMSMDVPVSDTLLYHPEPNALSYLLEIATDENFTSKVDSVNVSDTLYPYYDLEYDTEYFWRARSIGENGISDYSFTWQFTTKKVPVNLIAPDSAAKNIPSDFTLEWEAHSELDKYELLVSNSANFSDTLYHEQDLSQTTYDLTGIDNNNAFYWKVRAYSNERTAAWSYTWEFTTIIVSPVLRSPANGSSGQPTELTFIWFEVEGANYYHLQISRDEEFNDLIFSKDSLYNVQNVVSGLEPNTTYFWRVRAFNDDGPTAWSEVWSFTTFDVHPMLISPVDGEENVTIPIVCLWHSVENAANYQLQVALDEEFNDLIFSQDGISDTTYNVTEVDENQQYYWRVRALGEDFTSNWSEVWTFNTGANSVFDVINSEIKVYPNPARNDYTISLFMKEYSYVNISIIAQDGRTISTLNDGFLPAGSNEIMSNVRKLSAGTYFIIIEVNGSFINKQLKVIH